MRIHFLVPDPSGRIVSGPAGSTLKVGREGRWRVACDPKIVMGDQDRGTGEPWAVRCAACFKTKEFEAANRPKPGQAEAGADEVAAADMDCPCAGPKAGNRGLAEAGPGPGSKKAPVARPVPAE